MHSFFAVSGSHLLLPIAVEAKHIEIESFINHLFELFVNILLCFIFYVPQFAANDVLVFVLFH
jgi:hypothetical protein